MSEVSEACEVIMIVGRMIMKVKDFSVWMAISSAQVMSMIYHAKWDGKISYKRLLDIKGEQNGLLFLNVGVEGNTKKNIAKMKAVEKEMKIQRLLFQRKLMERNTT